MIDLFLYDGSDRAVNLLGKNAASKWGHLVHARPFNSKEHLAGILLALAGHKTQVNRLLIYTHGLPGMLMLGNGDNIFGGDFIELAGKGVENAFAPSAEIFFDGCELAQGKSGQFLLEQVAATLLFKAGGRAGGWDSKGYFWPGFGGTAPSYSADAKPCFAFIKAGTKQTRWAVGQPVLYPYGRWQVTVNAQKLEYGFLDNATVFRRLNEFSNSKLPAGSKTPGGTWVLYRDGLRIDWGNGESETWDVPLFEEHQTGVAYPGRAQLTAWQIDSERRKKMGAMLALP